MPYISLYISPRKEVFGMTSSEFATICLASLKSYSGKVDLLIFPYDNVSFLLRNDIVLEGDQKYVTYKLKQMENKIFYLVSKNSDGDISIKVGKLSSKVA